LIVDDLSYDTGKEYPGRTGAPDDSRGAFSQTVLCKTDWAGRLVPTRFIYRRSSQRHPGSSFHGIPRRASFQAADPRRRGVDLLTSPRFAGERSDRSCDPGEGAPVARSSSSIRGSEEPLTPNPLRRRAFRSVSTPRKGRGEGVLSVAFSRPTSERVAYCRCKNRVIRACPADIIATPHRGPVSPANRGIHPRPPARPRR